MNFFKSKKDGKSKKKDKEISLIVENTGQKAIVMKVAKSLLLKYSNVFRKMVESGELKKAKEIKLKGITALGLQKIVQYITTEAVTFQSHFEAIESLKVAYLYQVEVMNDICSNFLITAIKIDNVCSIYEFASSYVFELVEYHCLKFIDRHSEDVLKSPEFLTLKKHMVMDIVKRQSLDIPTEMVVFKTVMAWGLNDCLRRNVDADNDEEVLQSVKDLLSCVRFLTLSDTEMSDPEVNNIYKLLYAEDTSSKRRSLLLLDAKPKTSTPDDSSAQPRRYMQNYVYELQMADSDDHAVKTGETFCLRVEVLKGRVFLTGVTLAFERFVNSKNTSCLYVALSATNVKTTEQISARGAFMIASEEAAVKFPQPLVVKESESVEIALSVKRSINVCSMTIKSESQIAIPERKDVVLKILPSATTGGTERSMFKGIKYFY